MNIKALRRILLLALVISLVLITAVSCNDNDGKNTNDNDEESIFVNFIVDGKLYASLEPTDSEDFQYPAEPTKEGYVFDNWYVDEDTYIFSSCQEMPLSTVRIAALTSMLNGT